MPSQPVRDLTSYVSAYVPLLATLVAVGVGWMQYYVQRQHQRQNLFEKRFEIYRAVNALWSAALEGHPLGVNRSAYLIFREKTKSAKYLFGSDVQSLIRDFEAYAPGEAPSVDMRFTELDSGEAMQRLLELGNRTETVFEPYLRIYHDHCWIVRQFKRLNQWVDSRPDVLRTRYDEDKRDLDSA
jgi:hypothetical protein